MPQTKLNDFLQMVNSDSTFQCELGMDGGYINLKNSGQRGSVKQFTLSLHSIKSAIEDMMTHLEEFKAYDLYQEKSWRDLGAEHFNDLALRSLITVQTKPCFTVLSKIICWANDLPFENDNQIPLSRDYLTRAINLLNLLIQQYTPRQSITPKHTTSRDILILEETSIRQFVLSVYQFLFSKNQLAINSLLKETKPNSKVYSIKQKANSLSAIFIISSTPLSKEEAAQKDLANRFFDHIEYNSTFYYLSNQWTDNGSSRLDLQNFKTIFNNVYANYKIIDSNNTYQLIEKTNKPQGITPLPKPFLLLAGISGTGKTRFVREQAKTSGDLGETYQLVPVRPDWHEPSDLLGYVSRLSGKTSYIATDFLTFMVKAWKAIQASGASLSGNAVSGSSVDLESIRPFWLCLDEMNLAPVEQYFADYLSILETREWRYEEEQYSYTCDPILSASVFKELGHSSDSALDGFAHALSLDLKDSDDAALWEHFRENGISLPFNLIVAGTVNMDETTHGFSRKVIDRALSFDFGEFFPNNFDEYFEPSTRMITLGFPLQSDGRNIQALADTVDNDGNLSIEFLKAVNSVLQDTPFQLAYRALNELLLSVMTCKPKNNQELQAVWDDFMMCKVLPRIEGDSDKLAKNGDSDDDNLLTLIENILEEQFAEIWNGERMDLYRTQKDDSQPALMIPCRSKSKLRWMNQRLQSFSFTSFWP